ncbi:MAG: prepilin peptidase [Vicinamibacterales bacterium]
MTAFDAGALVVAGGACITDVRAARIPNTLTLLGVIAGLLAHALLPAGAGVAASLAGAAAGLAVFLPFFVLGGMGGGDVKLMAAVGAWLGWPTIVTAALTIAIVGGGVALGVAVTRGYLRQALGNLLALARFWIVAGVRPEPSLTLAEGRGPRLPYAVPILLGLLVTLWRR